MGIRLLTYFAAAISAYMLIGCGYPDLRSARVVVYLPESGDTSLADDAQFALDWWLAATHDISAQLADECDWDYACTTIVYGELDHKWGQTSHWQTAFNEHHGSHITIAPGLTPGNQRYTIAHEIGHSFGVHHVSAPIDLMYAHIDERYDVCIGSATFVSWRQLYGYAPFTPVCYTGIGIDESL